MISNTKAAIHGPRPGAFDKHLQAYLSEIAYRFDRRYREKELFDHLVKACVSTGTLTYHQLTTTHEDVVS